MISAALRAVVFHKDFTQPILLPAIVTALEAWTPKPPSRTHALCLHFDLDPKAFENPRAVNPLTAFNFTEAKLQPFSELEEWMQTLQRTAPAGADTSAGLQAIAAARKPSPRGSPVVMAFFAIVRLPKGGETGCWGGLGWSEPHGWNPSMVDRNWEGQLKERIATFKRDHALKAKPAPVESKGEDSRCQICRKDGERRRGESERLGADT